MTQGERIKEIRSSLSFTLEKFGEKLGVGKTAISKIENGDRSLTDQMLKSVCREYNVNENWLRTGEGEMFNPVSRNDDLARLTKNLLNEESDSFKNRFISMLANLTEDEWELLERKALELFEGRDGK